MCDGSCISFLLSLLDSCPIIRCRFSQLRRSMMIQKRGCAVERSLGYAIVSVLADNLFGILVKEVELVHVEANAESRTSNSFCFCI